MDLIKLLPILFVVAQGEGRAVEHPQQLLPVIPGYVPVYIQQGPDVEVIYETGRKAVVGPLHQEKRKAPEKLTKPEEEEEMKKKVEEGMVMKEEEMKKTQEELMMKEKEEMKKKTEMKVETNQPEVSMEVTEVKGQPAEPSPLPAGPEQQNSITEKEGESQTETTKVDRARGVGTVQEVASYRAKQR